MGTGKSTLIGRLAKDLAHHEKYNSEKVLPILLTAKEMLDIYKSDTNNLIQKTIENNDIKGEKSYLIIIDALDELKINSSERFEFLKQLSYTCRKDRNIKLIVTTRNIEEPELEVAIEQTIHKILPLFSYCRGSCYASRKIL